MIRRSENETVHTEGLIPDSFSIACQRGDTGGKRGARRQKGEAVITLIGHSRFTRRADKTVYVQAGLLGDADLNGRINVIDATAIQRHLANLAPFSEMQLAAADVDGDGEVTIQDVTVLQLWLAEFAFGETGIGEPVDRG